MGLYKIKRRDILVFLADYLNEQMNLTVFSTGRVILAVRGKTH